MCIDEKKLRFILSDYSAMRNAVHIGKKSMVSLHLFSRPEMSCRRKKMIEGGGGGKDSCCEWPNSYKENEDTRNIGIYI